MPSDAFLASSMLLPGNPPPALAGLPRAYPAYVILVHGVNDVGEAYASQEKGICEGLNDRLCRRDLKPAQYVIPDRTTAQGIQDLQTYMDTPESHYFRRSPQQGVYSPVIPFYWGSREEDAKIQKHTKHGQWLDQYGNRVDRDGSKNGGPFANACSALTDMWEHGCHKMAMGVLSLNWAGGTPTHPLLDAGSRRYMVLAAKRLAMLITIIRDRHAKNGLPPAAINLIAHSQGCMLSLLAHAFLADEKKLPVDCLIMNNSTFSLEESFVDGAIQMKNAQQSTHARVTTLKDIVAFLTSSPATSPAFTTILDPLKNQLLTGQHPGKVKHPHTGQDHSFQDRDNRGRVFLYFCPKDLTVGFTSVQGIGWQGVPDRMTYTVDRLKREWDVLTALGDRFHQRVWTDLARDQAPPVLVGQAERSTYTLRDKKAKDGDFWGWAKSHTLRKEPEPGETRTLQAPKIPIPWKPNLAYGEKQGTAGFLDVSPIDAAIAVTNQGEKKTTDLTTADPKGVRPRTKFVNDPRTPWERPGDVQGGSEGWLSSTACQQVTAGLNQGKEPRDCIEVLSAQAHGGNRLEITYRESFREAQERWMFQEVDANSYHSGIIANPDHSRRVTAYDLAIAPIYASTETEKMTRWMKENEDFLNYLREVGDWRKKTKDFTNMMKQKEYKHFYDQEPPSHKTLMEATAYYYWLGELPAGLKGTGKIKEGEWKIPSLVKCETVSEVSLHNAPFNGSRYQSQGKS